MTVNGVNDPPELAAIADQTVVWGTPIATITPSVTDPDANENHTFSLTGSLPNGVTFNSTTGVIAGTPHMNSIGSYPLTLLVTDSQGAVDSEDFTITVINARRH